MISDILYVKGKCDKTEFIMTVLVPVLVGVLAFVLIKNHTGAYGAILSGRLLPPIIIPSLIWAVTLVLGGISSYRAKLVSPESVAHVFYAVQLLLMFLWSMALFRFEQPKYAFILLIVGLIFLTAAFFEFEKIDRKAGFLMLPAVGWVVALAVVCGMCL